MADNYLGLPGLALERGFGAEVQPAEARDAPSRRDRARVYSASFMLIRVSAEQVRPDATSALSATAAPKAGSPYLPKDKKYR